MKKRLFTAVLALAILMGLGTPAFAEQSTLNDMTIQSISGVVSLTDSSGGALACAEGTILPGGFTLTTDAESCAVVTIDDTKTVKTDALTTVSADRSGGKTDLSLDGGALFLSITKKPSGSEQLSTHTPSMLVVPDGVFSGVLSAAEGIERVEVYDGSARVSFLSGADAVTVLAGQALTLTGDGAKLSPVSAGGIPAFAAAEMAAAEPQKTVEQKTKSSVRTKTPTPDSTGQNNMFKIGDGDPQAWNATNLAALAAGNKITLLGDIGTAETPAAKLEVGVKDVTLDLNGYTLYGSIEVAATGKLTIEDKSVSKTGKIIRKDAVVITNNGYLTISGGRIEIAEPSASNAPVVIDSIKFGGAGAPNPSLEIGSDAKIVSGSRNFNGSTAVYCRNTNFVMSGGSISGAGVLVNVTGIDEDVHTCSSSAVVRLEGGSFEMSDGTIESLGESYAVYLKPFGVTGDLSYPTSFSFTGGTISSARGHAVCFSYQDGRYPANCFENELFEKLGEKGASVTPPAAAQICKTVYGSGSNAPFKTVFTAYAADKLGKAFDNITDVAAAKKEAGSAADAALADAQSAMNALYDAVKNINVPAISDAKTALKGYCEDLQRGVLPDYDKSGTKEDVAGVLKTIEDDEDIRREINNIDTLTNNVGNTLQIAHKIRNMAGADIKISSTVELYANCTMTGIATIPADISFTLSGNGHALDLKGYTLKGQVSLSGSLTLTDSSEGQTGTIYYPGEDGSAIIGNGSLTLKLGAISAPKSQVSDKDITLEPADAAATLSYEVAGKEIYLHAYKKGETEPTNIDALFEALGEAPEGAVSTITLHKNCVTRGNNKDKYTFTLVDNGYELTYGPMVYTITATAGVNGTITPSGAVEVTEGDGKTFNIAANEGYKIKDVKVDDESEGSLGSYTFTNVTEDHTIAATFEAITYAVTLDANGGTANGSATATYNSNTLTALLPPTKEGYTPSGYYTAASSGTMVSNASGALQANVSGYTGAGGIWTKTENATLYAQWTANEYTVAFDKNATDATGSMGNQSFTYDVEKALTGNAFTRTGYNFAGWATSETGDVAYSDKQSVQNLTAVSGGTVTLYAKWTPVISFDTQPAASTTVTERRISASLTAAATVPGGTPTLNWYACDAGGTIPGASLGTGGTFAIPTDLAAGTYYYICEATFAGAETVNSHVAAVTVKKPAIIDPDPPGGGGGSAPTTPTPPPVTPPVTEPWVNPFTDVGEKDWFYDAVKYCNENGLMDGTDADEFKPTGVVSRAEVWQVLANLAGVETDTTKAPWYGDAQAWAESVGITDGSDPTGEVTREQLVTMLYRYYTLIAKGEFEGGMSAKEFEDFADVSQWAELAVQWGVTDGIIEGSDNKLKPGGDATRAELAAMLMRFDKLLKAEK